jgi:uncharacterized membrane protein YkvA (DUF1232 family)
MHIPTNKIPSILQSMRKKTKQISAPLLYAGLLMFYAMVRKDTPKWAQRIILGGFAYLFTPIDAVPDIAPIIGYTDDLGVMFYALVLVAAYIDPQVRTSAMRTLQSWIGEVDEVALKKVNELF